MVEIDNPDTEKVAEIVEAIAKGENTASEIIEEVSFSEPTVYNYLKTLCKKDILEKKVSDNKLIYAINKEELKDSEFGPRGDKDIWEIHTEREEIREIVEEHIFDGGISGQGIFEVMKKIQDGQKIGKFDHLDLPEEAIEKSEGQEGATAELIEYFVRKYSSNWAEDKDQVLKMGMDVNVRREGSFEDLI